jgi:hypothetical protein
MVHVDTPTDTCRQWNQARPASSSYSEEIFEDLACRFERPDTRNRWDAPLFTLRPLLGGSQLQEQLEAVAAAVADAPPPQQRAAAASAVQGAAAAESQVGAADVATGADAAAGPPAADEPPQVLLTKELKPHVATSTLGSKLAGGWPWVADGSIMLLACPTQIDAINATLPGQMQQEALTGPCAFATPMMQPPTCSTT